MRTFTLRPCRLTVSSRPRRPPSASSTIATVRPILAENCFACHGPDSASRKASLRLDQRDAAVKAEAFVPGKPDDSEMVRRLFETNPRQVMPPPASHKKLTAEQKARSGSGSPRGRSTSRTGRSIAPVRPAVPAVKNKGWVRNPVDAFILAQLEAKRLTPAPEADRRTLARRGSLDLTGLPPAPAEVERSS